VCLGDTSFFIVLKWLVIDDEFALVQESIEIASFNLIDPPLAKIVKKKIERYFLAVTAVTTSYSSESGFNHLFPPSDHNTIYYY